MKRLLALVTALFVAGIAFAVDAGAHVTVTAPGATRGGGDQEITFRVPVEKDSPTTGVTVVLPTATPIASVDVAPIPGWTHTQKTSKLANPIKTDDGDITSAVTQITWKADAGQGLKPGEFGAFTIIAGQLPDVAQVQFKALQTYADGSVVKWVQTAAPGSSDEPEFPAPTLELAAASKDDDNSSSDVTATSSDAANSSSSDSSSSNTGPIVLSIIALVLAAGALGLVVVGRARKESS